MDRRGFGFLAEDAAARWLESNGYRIRERNFHCPYGEIDIVAEKDELVCFVEVRARSWGDPAETVSPPKQRRVVRAALQYLLSQRLNDVGIRFDVITVVGRGRDAEIEHIADAFDAGM